MEVMLRPEQITVRPLGAPAREFADRRDSRGDDEPAVGTVVAVAFHGPLTAYRVAVSGIGLSAVVVGVPVANVGDEVFVNGPVEPVVGWPGGVEET